MGKRQHGGKRLGAGRPRIYGPHAQPTSLLLELEQLVRLDHWAGKLNISRSAAVKQAVCEWITSRETNN